MGSQEGSAWGVRVSLIFLWKANNAIYNGMDVDSSRPGQPPPAGHCGQAGMRAASPRTFLMPTESPGTEASCPDAPKLVQILLPLLTPLADLCPFVGFGTRFRFVRNEVNRKPNADSTGTGFPGPG